MTLEANLLKDLQDDIGLDDTETVFTDIELERFYTRAQSNQDLAVYYAYRVLLANADKMFDYTIGMTTEKRSQVRAHIKDTLNMWSEISGSVDNQVEMLGARKIPEYKKSKPWQNRQRDSRRNTSEWDEWQG